MTENTRNTEEEEDATPENLTRRSGDGIYSQSLSGDADKLDDTSISQTEGSRKSIEYDEQELLDFFKKKGSVEILAQLADGPKRFTEINDALTVSHGTISNRLKDGAKLKLWGEYVMYPDDGGKIKFYELRTGAKDFGRIALEEDIIETTEQKRKAFDQHNVAVSNFREKLRSAE